MSKFIVILSHKRVGTLTTDLLEKHVTHLRKLDQDEILYLCGPFTNNDGALQILEAENIDQAKNLVLSDPMIKANFYQDFKIYQLCEANENNNYLTEITQHNIDYKKVGES